MANQNKRKIFIVGLPRTGTTSLCAAFLEQGAFVAHTAFSQAAFEQANVVADAPVFSDYPLLDSIYPGAKFIYLHRAPELWLPSISMLLLRIKERYKQKPTAFSPVLLNAYQSVFGEGFLSEDLDRDDLFECYSAHRETIKNYFNKRKNTMLEVSLVQSNVSQLIGDFVGLAMDIPHLNKQGKISDWSRIKHPRKVDPNLSGVNARKYFKL